MLPIFEIHLEEWNHALHIEGRGHKSPIDWIFDLKIKPIVYMLDDWAMDNRGLHWRISERGILIRSHGAHHYYDEKADRSPYFNQEGLPFPPSGGFFFRLLPLWYVREATKRSGVFWIHPHDLDEQHPRLDNVFYQWKRHVGLKGARYKLERLINEIEWGTPSPE